MKAAPEKVSFPRVILLVPLAVVIAAALILGVLPLTDCPSCRGTGQKSAGVPCVGPGDTCGGDGRTSILHRLQMKSHWAAQGSAP